MRSYLAIALAFALTLLAGCSVQPQHKNADDAAARVAEHLDSTTLPADADLSTPPPATLYFAPDWKQSVSDTVYAGATLEVEASPTRFPTCGISGTVTVSALLDDGSIIKSTLDQRTQWWAAGSLTIPTGTHQLQLWLRSERPDGCVEYDSNFEKNYSFTVHAWDPTTVHFKSDWSEVADAPLVAGGVLVVDYDMARLPKCRDSYRDIPTWDVLAHLRFDTGKQMTQTVANWDAPYGVKKTAAPGLAVFPIPEGARHVELWFENSEWTPGYPLPAGCPAWDSDYGNNYPFDIQPGG